jgi:hypothetical protein
MSETVTTKGGQKPGAPYTQGQGSGKGSNWPKAGDLNTKGWSEKAGKGAAHPAQPKPK